MALRLIRLPEVLNRIGISKTNVYRLIPEGKFPKPVRLGPNSVAWLEEDIDAWILERAKAA